MAPKRGKQRPATATEVCPNCGRTFNVRGYGRHRDACRAAPTSDAEGSEDQELSEGM